MNINIIKKLKLIYNYFSFLFFYKDKNLINFMYVFFFFFIFIFKNDIEIDAEYIIILCILIIFNTLYNLINYKNLKESIKNNYLNMYIYLILNFEKYIVLIKSYYIYLMNISKNKFFFLELILFINKKLIKTFSKYNINWIKNYINLNINLKLKKFILLEYKNKKILFSYFYKNKKFNYSLNKINLKKKNKRILKQRNWNTL